MVGRWPVALGVPTLLAAVLGAVWLTVGSSRPSRTADPESIQGEKCPVCGMFAAKYPAWICRVRFSDGRTVYFDGPKDMFKYYFDVGHYQPPRTVSMIRAVEVTDYYAQESIDGYRARFVVGSDVYGPMGKELIPFASEDAAREFQRDHAGDRVLQFHDVSPDLVSRLE